MEYIFKGKKTGSTEVVYGHYYTDQRFIDGVPCADVSIIRDESLDDHFVYPDSVTLVSQWQPIETAPRNGDIILIYTKDGTISTAFWSDSVWLDKAGFISEENRSDTITLGATHWMPLPKPPKGDNK